MDKLGVDDAFAKNYQDDGQNCAVYWRWKPQPPKKSKRQSALPGPRRRVASAGPQAAYIAMLNPEQSKYTGERREFWDEFARRIERWQPLRRYYRARLARWFSFAVPPGARVLEIGCGTGDLLAALRPSVGVGIDFSPEMVRVAEERHPDCASSPLTRTISTWARSSTRSFVPT